MAVLDGRAIAGTVLQSVKEAYARSGLRRPPRVAIVLANSRADSQAYVRHKLKALADVGFDACLHTVGIGRRVPPWPQCDLAHTESIDTPRAVAELVRGLDADESVDGILVQMPVEPTMESTLAKCRLYGDASQRDGGDCTDAAEPSIPVAVRMPQKFFDVSAPKDVDGLRPETLGLLAVQGTDLSNTLLPCTGQAVMAMLRRALSCDNADFLRGLNVTVVGRSPVAGMPCALLAMRAGATVTVCHGGTTDLAFATRSADVIVSAAGVPGLIGSDHVKPGAIVVDVGISRVSSGEISASTAANHRLVGDVDFVAVSRIASVVSPVPGGVGPVTVAMLVRNVLLAALLHRGRQQNG